MVWFGSLILFRLKFLCILHPGAEQVQACTALSHCVHFALSKTRLCKLGPAPHRDLKSREILYRAGPMIQTKPWVLLLLKFVRILHLGAEQDQAAPVPCLRQGKVYTMPRSPPPDTSTCPATLFCQSSSTHSLSICQSSLNLAQSVTMNRYFFQNQFYQNIFSNFTTSVQFGETEGVNISEAGGLTSWCRHGSPRVVFTDFR